MIVQKKLLKAQVAEKKLFKCVFKDAAKAAKLYIRQLIVAKKAEVAVAKLAARQRH